MIKKIRNTFNILIYYIRRIFRCNSEPVREIIDKFHKYYYESHDPCRAWLSTFWLGVQTEKLPLDLWIYQEIIFEIKPDIIIETGTFHGGSALFLASICDLINNGRVVTIDIEGEKDRPMHKRITYLLGSSTSEEIISSLKNSIGAADKVMVILDSDHTKNHVLSELRIYCNFVTIGSYLIVEDTNLNGHPIAPAFGPGPAEAAEDFLKENKNFVIDKSKEKLYFTFNPNGYLKRTR